MQVNVYLKKYQTKNRERRFLLVIRRRGMKDETINIGPVSPKIADQKRAVLLSELLTGTYAPESVLSPLLPEFWEKFLNDYAKGERKANTVVLYETCTKLFRQTFRDHYLHEITRQDLDRHFSSQNVGGRTKNIELSTLRLLFLKAVEWGFLNKSPLDGMKRFKEKSKGTRSLTLAEIALLQDHATPWTRHVISLIAGLGLRRHEAINLRFSDVDKTNNRVRILGKGDKLRFIPLNSEIRKEIDFLWNNYPNQQYGASKYEKLPPYLKRSDEQRVYVFCHPDGTPLKSFAASLKKLYDKLGIEGVAVHGLRKTFCTQLARQGVHPRVTQELAGHSDSRLTMDIYTQVEKEQLQEAVDKLPPIFAAPCHLRVVS